MLCRRRRSRTRAAITPPLYGPGLYFADCMANGASTDEPVPTNEAGSLYMQSVYDDGIYIMDCLYNACLYCGDQNASLESASVRLCGEFGPSSRILSTKRACKIGMKRFREKVLFLHWLSPCAFWFRKMSQFFGCGQCYPEPSSASTRILDKRDIFVITGQLSDNLSQPDAIEPYTKFSQ